MPRSPIAALLMAEHYRQQVAVRAMAVQEAWRLWQFWVPGDAESWRRMVKLAYPVLAARHAVSAAASARMFETLALAETGEHAPAVLAEALPVEMVEKSLAATGLVGVVVARSRGQSLQAAAQNGFVRFSGSYSRMALSGGRDTVLRSVDLTDRARGYERTIGGRACSFCSGLAGEHSGAEAFDAHDHCSCSAAPVFA